MEILWHFHSPNSSVKKFGNNPKKADKNNNYFKPSNLYSLNFLREITGFLTSENGPLKIHKIQLMEPTKSASRNLSCTLLAVFHKFSPPEAAQPLHNCSLNPHGIPMLMAPLHKLGLNPLGLAKLTAHLSLTLKQITALLFCTPPAKLFSLKIPVTHFDFFTCKSLNHQIYTMTHPNTSKKLSESLMSSLHPLP